MWFLVKLRDVTSKSYYIIDKQSLINVRRELKHGALVRFRFMSGDVVLVGTVVYKSESLDAVNEEKEFLEPEKWLLVQYTNSRSNVIHRVINNTDIVLPPLAGVTEKEEICFIDRKSHVLATVVCISNSRQDTLDQLHQLKCNIAEFEYKKEQTTKKKETNWGIAQFSCTKTSVSYAIISCRKTDDRDDTTLIKFVNDPGSRVLATASDSGTPNQQN